MSYFDENTLTTVQDLWKNLSYPPSDMHKPEFLKQEEEVLDFYKGWATCLNQTFNDDSESGKKFYNIDQTITFDLFGFTGRSDFKEHFEQTFPYFSNARVDYKDLEIIITSPTSAFSTMVQRLRGKSQDDKPFEMTYRITAILIKQPAGNWQWIHEHVSFPVNMATKEADFTSTIDPKTAFHF
ncbi:MAG: hypothetical protein M1819_006975 [Sarea resinae]|nr:MAG: hypothetical protein M1819_006975 [Sarea resinae]